MLQSLDEGPRGKREFNLKQDLQLGWKIRKLWQEYRKRVSLVDFQNIFSSHRILLTPTKNLKTIRLTSQSNVLNISKWHISRKWEARWRKCRIISVILLSGLSLLAHTNQKWQATELGKLTCQLFPFIRLKCPQEPSLKVSGSLLYAVFQFQSINSIISISYNLQVSLQ